ncbi:MAG: NUDIX hydrolase [Candidatus Wolfebacteria bacterium]|nr:NUDIX hydrolase [Candidatus Wolfebacteria bacterium]
MKWPVPGEMKEIMKKYDRQVIEQDFTLPDGEVKNFFLFAASTKPAIVLAVTKDRKVLAIKQFRYGACDVVTEIPGGNAKPGQSMEDCITDELLEETGFKAKKLVKLGEGIWFDPASWRASFTAFVALDCKRVAEPNLDPTEILEWMTVPLNKWLGMAMRGEIKDAKTLAITLMAPVVRQVFVLILAIRLIFKKARPQHFAVAPLFLSRYYCFFGLSRLVWIL